jgi:hypothetical protein
LIHTVTLRFENQYKYATTTENKSELYWQHICNSSQQLRLVQSTTSSPRPEKQVTYFHSRRVYWDVILSRQRQRQVTYTQ